MEFLFYIMARKNPEWHRKSNVKQRAVVDLTEEEEEGTSKTKVKKLTVQKATSRGRSRKSEMSETEEDSVNARMSTGKGEGSKAAEEKVEPDPSRYAVNESLFPHAVPLSLLEWRKEVEDAQKRMVSSSKKV